MQNLCIIINTMLNNLYNAKMGIHFQQKFYYFCILFIYKKKGWYYADKQNNKNVYA